MSYLRKILLFLVVAAVAVAVMQTAQPKTAPAVAVLISSGLIGLIWLRLSRKQKDESIYVALTLLAVATGVGVGLAL